LEKKIRGAVKKGVHYVEKLEPYLHKGVALASDLGVPYANQLSTGLDYLEQGKNIAKTIGGRKLTATERKRLLNRGHYLN